MIDLPRSSYYYQPKPAAAALGDAELAHLAWRYLVGESLISRNARLPRPCDAARTRHLPMA